MEKSENRSNSETMKIGILGGTFDPPHFGHLRIAEEVREFLNLKKVIFVPAGYPPHKKEGTYSSFSHRFEMVKLAIKDNPFFEVSDIEKDENPSYTLKTLQKLQKLLPSCQLFFILGIDAFSSIDSWWHWEKLFKYAKFVVVRRPLEGEILKKKISHLLQLPFVKKKVLFFENSTLFEISSTQIRELVKAGRSIKYLLPEKVEEYILEHYLYK